MGHGSQKYPYITVDIIIEIGASIVLVERKFPPYGWALPGGFVDLGETLEEAAVREAREETSLDISLSCQLHAYSDPKRDERSHNISVVFAASASGTPKAADDAASARLFAEEEIPAALAFDHGRIVREYFRWKREGFSAYKLD